MDIYAKHTDETLFSLMQENDEKAFTELYDRYWLRLLTRANFLLNSQEDAEETVHDIFVCLWRKRKTLHILHSFHTYISAMLHYDCLKVLAKRKRLRAKELVGVAAEKVDISTEQWLAFGELREEMEAVISKLPDRCQLIFRLSREQFLSDKEIARKLDLSVNTVRTQMHRALQRLRTSLSFLF